MPRVPHGAPGGVSTCRLGSCMQRPRRSRPARLPAQTPELVRFSELSCIHDIASSRMLCSCHVCNLKSSCACF